MPTITINVANVTKEQKEALVAGLATKASEVLNIPIQAFTTYINEFGLENIGHGTQLMSETHGKK